LAPLPVEVVAGFVVAGGNATPNWLGLIKAIDVVTEVAAAAHAGPGGGFVVVEVGGATGLLGGHRAQAHALIGKENGGAGKQELTELQDWIQAPALKDQDPAAQQANGRKKNVVIAGQGWFEAPHEIEERPAHGQHDSNDAGPVQAGIDHGGDTSGRDQGHGAIAMVRSVAASKAQDQGETLDCGRLASPPG
jgi:hypothetical protein